MIHSVAPLGGKVIGKASSQEYAWWLCRRYGLVPLPLEDAGVVDFVTAADGTKLWTVQCEHSAFPYDRGAFENRKRDCLAELDNGLPAWPVAEENGIAFSTFKARLKRGWSGERAATEGTRTSPPIRMTNGKKSRLRMAFRCAHFDGAYKLDAPIHCSDYGAALA